MTGGRAYCAPRYKTPRTQVGSRSDRRAGTGNEYDWKSRLRQGRDWTRPIGPMLRRYNGGAREAAHPTTSSSTGLRRQQNNCVISLIARNRALVTTWKDWGGQS